MGLFVSIQTLKDEPAFSLGRGNAGSIDVGSLAALAI
jgi:hypothetical protein